MSSTNAKVTLTTSQLKERLDKMLLVGEDRDKEFAAYIESEREHRKGEQEKVDNLLAYLETKEWRAKLESLRYKEVYVHPSPLGALFRYKGKWVKEMLPSDRELANVVYYLQNEVALGIFVTSCPYSYHADNGVTKVFIGNSNMARISEEDISALGCLLNVRSEIGYLNTPPTHSATLPIDRLRYMVSLSSNIEVDVEWLQEIDNIDK